MDVIMLISHGSAAVETLGVILPSFMLTFICTNICSTNSNGDSPILMFAIEFIAITIPIIVIINYMVDYIYIANVFLISMSFLFLLYNRKRIEEANRELKTDSGRQGFITNARSTINIITGVAILAVDFKMFPTRFHKTHHYGYSLMDVGVGLYVYANGILAPEIRGSKNSIWKTFKNVTPLLVVGVGRFLITTMLSYHVNVSEYGKHWNFFITLAVTKLVSAILMSLVQGGMVICALQGVAVLVLHQFLLHSGLEDFVVGDAKRDDFIAANREGIVSTLGYVGLYFLAVSFGYLINNRNKNRIHLDIALVTTVAILGLATVALDYYFNTSRCLANSAYCTWVMFIGVLMTTLYYFMEGFTDYFYSNPKKVITVPFTFDAINYNGLTFFLIANVLTGCVNMLCTPRKLDEEYGMAILIAYMFAVNAIVSVLYVKKIRLKL